MRPHIEITRPTPYRRIISCINSPLGIVVIGSTILSVAIVSAFRQPRYVSIGDGLYVLDNQTGRVESIFECQKINQ